MTAGGRRPDPSSLIRKWYFCINEAGFDTYFPLVIAAVASAHANTRLRPFCLYDGSNAAHAAQLAALGVTVIRHRSSLHDALQKGYGADFDMFRGHWLRVDLPLVDPSDDVILYTDFDILFLAPPRITRVPTVLGAGPEFELAEWRYFSSGVLVINLARMRALHGAFTAAIRQRLANDFSYPAHDQQSFNDFFACRLLNRIRRRERDWIPAENNWKPFWGRNADTRILHFHGPKPWDARRFAQGALDTSTPYRARIAALWQRNPDAYAEALALWDRYHAEGLALMASPGRPAITA